MLTRRSIQYKGSAAHDCGSGPVHATTNGVSVRQYQAPASIGVTAGERTTQLDVLNNYARPIHHPRFAVHPQGWCSPAPLLLVEHSPEKLFLESRREYRLIMEEKAGGRDPAHQPCPCALRTNYLQTLGLAEGAQHLPNASSLSGFLRRRNGICHTPMPQRRATIQRMRMGKEHSAPYSTCKSSSEGRPHEGEA